jgi:2,4-dienoyl-CoA reductase-like NADH-dependent reductase (Old Yellow Enzyme family)
MVSVECLLKLLINLRAPKGVDSNKPHKHYRHITKYSNAPVFTYRLLWSPCLTINRHKTMSNLFKPINFKCGVSMKNRFVLAPLTNTQSHADGTLSDDEYRWLTMRAEGGFGLTMTCAAHVQSVGQGFPGQWGIFGDEHLEGLTRLASGINSEQSLSVVQLHHAGMRSPEALIGEPPVCPSDNAQTGGLALSTEAVEPLIEDFICAAERVVKAGFDGV